MNIPLADYQKERAAFDAFLNPNCDKRILLFRGESGNGKTHLLSSFRDRAKAAGSVHYVNVDLKGTAVTVGEIFARIADRLGETRLGMLKQMVASLPGSPSINLTNVKQSGLGHEIKINLQVTDLANRTQRQMEMTNALFADLGALSQPVIFIFDTYQDAPAEVQDWISGPFLARLESTTTVRMIIAGQAVPSESNLDWGHCCELHDLKGVHKPEHWLPVVEAMGVRVPGTDALSWLAAICKLLNGRPSDIMNFLKGHQEKESSL